MFSHNQRRRVSILARVGRVVIASGVLSALALGLLLPPGGAGAQGPDDGDPPNAPADRFLFGDLRPDAPALAARGSYGVGVRTLDVVHPDQIDVLRHTPDTPNPRADRPLTLEIWYPALIPDDAVEITTYDQIHGIVGNPDRPVSSFSFQGRALRDAAPDLSGGPYPLVIVAHGYPGSRLMFTYLTENLASKGYVVVAIDHTDSTYADVALFGSTLLNRPLDILFVLDQMGQLGTAESDSFLAGLVDADQTALVGYSMGGYGALVAAGAGLSRMGVAIGTGQMNGSDALQRLEEGSDTLAELRDERIRAVILAAPWGMQLNLWTATALAEIDVPLLVIVGSDDDVSGYDNGVVRIFEGAVNADRYLLTYLHARHNVAPNPPPDPTVSYDEYLRYSEPVWDITRINNVNQHFVTAFLGRYLRGDDAYAPYLDLIEDASAGVWDMDDDGNPTDEHTYWAGFLRRSALGLTWRHLPAE